MSIKSLFQPNDYNIRCDTLECNDLLATTMVIPGTSTFNIIDVSQINSSNILNTAAITTNNFVSTSGVTTSEIDPLVTGDPLLVNNITVGPTGIMFNDSNSDNALLATYRVGSFTGSFTGSAVFNHLFYYTVIGNVASITFDEIFGNTTTTGQYFTISGIPDFLRPKTDDMYFQVWGGNNDTPVADPMFWEIYYDGVNLNMYWYLNYLNFSYGTFEGGYSAYNQTFTYILSSQPN